jgi:hypothetical protein
MGALGHGSSSRGAQSGDTVAQQEQPGHPLAPAPGSTLLSEPGHTHGRLLLLSAGRRRWLRHGAGCGALHHQAGEGRSGCSRGRRGGGRRAAPGWPCCWLPRCGCNRPLGWLLLQLAGSRWRGRWPGGPPAAALPGRCGEEEALSQGCCWWLLLGGRRGWLATTCAVCAAMADGSAWRGGLGWHTCGAHWRAVAA